MYRLLRPFLFRLEAEAAHGLGLYAARLGRRAPGIVGSWYRVRDERLSQSLWGVRFENPVGLAAGFDKGAELVPFWSTLGFGFCEVGSVTARASEGNPRPRAFRLSKDRALINRMGLNNPGADAVAVRLALLPRYRRPIPLGINIAKTHSPDILGDDAIEDFLYSLRRLAGLADYLALNVSCPNTAEGKTFEDPEALDALLRRVMAVRAHVAPSVPVLVKLSPPRFGVGRSLDLGPATELVAVARAHDVAGFIATNTAPDRSGLRTDRRRLDAIGNGGVSGRPLAWRSTALVRHLFRLTDGELPIIGVGGVDSADAAYRKIRAGASLLQVYTGLVYQGPGLTRRINRGLVDLLERERLGSISEAVGRDA
jgi:dihydroorotate dehydrogenase